MRLRTAPSSPVVGEMAFGRGKLARDGWFSCVVSVEADGEVLEMELGMISPYRADMLGFFEDLGRVASTGWDGELLWESEFAEIRIAATTAPAADVLFDVLMWWPPRYEETKRLTLAFRAEAVERAAQRMHDFLRMERGERFRAVRGSRNWSPRPT